MATADYPVTDHSPERSYQEKTSMAVIDEEGDVLIGTLLKDVKEILTELGKRVTDLEQQIQGRKSISTNSEQVKELMEFRQQFKAGPSILERLAKLEQNARTSVETESAATQTETCTSAEIEQTPASISFNDTSDALLKTLQSYSSFLSPVKRRYSRSNSVSMRKRSESKRSRWSGISSGIGSSFEFEDAQALHDLHEESIMQEPQNSISTEEEPTNTQGTASHKHQAVVWAMEDLVIAMKSLYS